MKLSWRIGIQQRVLPVYRTELFDMIAQECQAGLQIFAGAQRKGEGINESGNLERAVLFKANNHYIPLLDSHFLVQKNIVDWLRLWNPECLLVEANPRNISTPAAIRWAKKNNVKVFGWGLGVPTGNIFKSSRKKFWGMFLKKFDALITYSSNGKQSYADAGFAPKRIFVAPNAVTRRPENQILERPNLFVDRPNILTVGRMIEVKRIDKLLLACSHLPVDHQPKLTIVGDGPARDKWIKLAEEVYPQAFFPGDVRGNLLEAYFKAADLFVLPGSGGLAVQQAMSYSLPVIVGAADGTQTDLVRSMNGRRLKDDEVDTLVLALQEALADAGRLRRMGKESRRIIRDEVNLEKMVEAFTSAIYEVMSNP